MRAAAILIFVLFLAVGSATSEVVVNEVLANEPGSATSLEWIELFNNSPVTINLLFYQLRICSATDSTVLALDGAIDPQQYLVLCRDTTRFEQHWGDSSGVWGDAVFEKSYSVRQLSFQLANSSGRVAILSLTSIPPRVVSQLAWTETGKDGYSWERVHPALDSVGQSIDPTGSTPGRMNSITPLPIDLSLDDVIASSNSGLTELVFRIVNRGLTTVNNPILELYKFDSAAPQNQGAVVAGESVGPVDSGFTVLLVGRYPLPGYYQKLVANLVVLNDDRPANNHLTFTAPGSRYPPIILNEFLSNPTPPVGSEWVELKNTSDTIIDLAGWHLGDSAGLADIASGELLCYPHEYLVLVQDSGAFIGAYPLFTGRVHQPPAWRTLNNTSDSVRLIDSYDIRADQFYYTKVYDSNHTWARSESTDNSGRWGRSEDAGGTPGDTNLVRFAPEGSTTLSISIEPRIISPDGDGRDDSAVIKIQVSRASSYSLKIYDSQGRLVRTIEDEVPDLKEQYVWRGDTDSGERLPIGIYILFVEASGVESAKKTIVVAR